MFPNLFEFRRFQLTLFEINCEIHSFLQLVTSSTVCAVFDPDTKVFEPRETGKRSLVSQTSSKVFCSMENVTWIETMKGRECGVTSSPPTIAVARLLWRRWRRRNRKDMILLSACSELNSAETEISNIR